jgi:hypothetical protein
MSNQLAAAIAEITEAYRGTEHGKVAESIGDAIRQALAAHEAAKERTGWPAEGRMAQDDSRELSKWLSNTPGARRLVDEAAKPAEPPHNPWRESLENCITGDNYLRASEYRELIDELDFQGRGVMSVRDMVRLVEQAHGIKEKP